MKEQRSQECPEQQGMYDPSFEHDNCGIGAVVNIKGIKSHKTVEDALSIVENLEHRAGKDAEGKTGDGVGIMVQISHKFFSKECAKLGIELGGEREYGIGMFFLPQDELKRNQAKKMFEIIVEKEGMNFLGWREVTTNPKVLGSKALEKMPSIMQAFIQKPEDVEKGLDFDRKLYIARRVFEQSIEDTYVVSCSSRTLIYKGMFLVGQLRSFFQDLQSPDYESAIALVHSRFSTNTMPSWERAHPYRFLVHNGEINTIKGNADKMLAREETVESEHLKGEFHKILPVISASGSDSAMLDNTLEFLVMSGMDLALAVMILIPEPWLNNRTMSQKKKDFYQYYATMMEPWDGPASILFTDGDVMGAVLDRNGLRPSRYYVTTDDQLILSSEVGVLDIDPSRIVEKERLHPGKMLLVDTKQGKIIDDDELKEYYGKIQYSYSFNLNGSRANRAKTEKSIQKQLQKKFANCSIESRELSRESFYELYGGFLFIGIFLGIIFLMATTLIIYYKQISEGYDDRERYQIMQKVGMSKKEVRQSIRSQVLLVFFLPLIMAVIHLAFAFKIITKLLSVLNLTNVSLFFMYTVGTVAVFAVIYAIIYSITAKEYYKILIC